MEVNLLKDAVGCKHDTTAAQFGQGAWSVVSAATCRRRQRNGYTQSGGWIIGPEARAGEEHIFIHHSVQKRIPRQVTGQPCSHLLFI